LAKQPPEATAARGPGRPASGARERVLEAGFEVLKEEGYAGLTTAKVAARSGQNKALISYHFGSKQGLVAAVGREVRESITAEVLGGMGEPTTVKGVVQGLLDGLWRVIEADPRLTRLYFDLAAVSVVERDVRTVMREMKLGWQEVTTRLLLAADDGPSTPEAAEAGIVLVMAGVEGLALERLERAEDPALSRARELFVSSASAAIRAT
jgi:TetR/AcrR family transcriptional regulator, transcriptional repressor of bet genes